MEMHQVRYFLATCETLNFTKAAEISNVSQPALTKAVRLLEGELGGELFDRQSRPLHLTDLGEVLRDRFVILWDVVTEIKMRSKRFNGLEESSFTLGVVNTISEGLLVAIKNHLQAHLPGVTVLIKHASEGLLITELRDGLIELAVMSNGPYMTGRFDGVTLYEESYVVVGSPDHPLFESQHGCLADINGLEYIYRLHCEKNHEVDELLSSNSIKVRSIMLTDQDELARRIIIAGAGVTIMPESMATAPLAALVFEDINIKRIVQVISLSNRQLSPVADKVRAALIAAYSNK